MKRLLDKTDPTTLWEEDGDLQRMRAFFHTIEADSENIEQIKQNVKQKALDKMAKIEKLGELPVPVKDGVGKRLRAIFRTLTQFRSLKLSLSIAGLAIFMILGQAALNGSTSIFPRMGGLAKSTQNESISPQSMRSTGAADTDGKFSAKSKESSDSSTMSGVPEQADSLYSMGGSDQAIVPPADTGITRKITHDLELTLEVATVNEAVKQISQEVQQLGGYVVTSQQSGSDSHSSAHLTVKIPANKLIGLQDSFATWGKVLDQRMQANDITNEYYDSQARLQILEAEEKRYLEILNQAETVDDVLKVENALGNVRQQIEHLKGQLKLWNHQVDYSTVTLQIVTHQSPKVNVKDPWQPISWSETWKAVGDAVLKTLSSTWNGLNYLVVGIGYASPYLLMGALGWGIYRLWRKRRSE